VALLSVLFHDRPSGHFFGPLAVAPFLLGFFLDVFVLALLFGANAAQMLLPGHVDLPSSWHDCFRTHPAAATNRIVCTLGDVSSAGGSVGRVAGRPSGRETHLNRRSLPRRLSFDPGVAATAVAAVFSLAFAVFHVAKLTGGRA
jgi:hypothetical protein